MVGNSHLLILGPQLEETDFYYLKTPGEKRMTCFPGKGAPSSVGRLTQYVRKARETVSKQLWEYTEPSGPDTVGVGLELPMTLLLEISRPGRRDRNHPPP